MLCEAQPNSCRQAIAPPGQEGQFPASRHCAIHSHLHRPRLQLYCFNMKKLLAALSLFVLAGIFYLAWIFLTMPDVASLARTNPKTTALMEQRAAEKNQKVQPLHTWVPYRKISIHLRNAVLVSEDSAFFTHAGFDWTQIK